MSCISQIKIRRGNSSDIPELEVTPGELIMAKDTYQLYVGSNGGTKYIPLKGEGEAQIINKNRVGTFYISFVLIGSSSFTGGEQRAAMRGSLVTFLNRTSTRTTGYALGNGLTLPFTVVSESTGGSNIILAREVSVATVIDFPDLLEGESVSWMANSTYGILIGDNYTKYIKVYFSAKTEGSEVTISADIPDGLPVGDCELIIPDFSGEIGWNS